MLPSDFACHPQGIKSCPMILVFGCRQSEMDHIYKEETLQAKNKDVFKELYAAYSREPGKPKVRIPNIHDYDWASGLQRGLEMSLEILPT